MNAVYRSLTNYGWLLALLVAIAALFVAYLGFNPVKTAIDDVGEPALKASGIIAGVCPDGFKDASSKDEHGKVSACFLGTDPKAPRSGDYIISLNSEGFCSHAIQVDVPRPRLECSEVPGWPK